jgi:hypothetical protein
MSLTPTPLASPRVVTPTLNDTQDAAGNPNRPVSLKDGDLATPIPLHDFMHELGVILQLPRKRTTAAISVIEVAPLTRRRTAVVLPAIAILMSVAVVWAKAMTPSLPREIPPTLLGEWVTTHPNYRERRLSFTEHSVGISLRDGQAPELHHVNSVATNRTADTTRFTITYIADEVPVEFRLVYVAMPSPRVELSNPPGVLWEKAAVTKEPTAASK